MERGGALSARAVLGVVVRPELWAVALRQAWRLAPAQWWRRWPPLPLPDREYLRFRMVTYYGDPDRRPDVRDLVEYLKWCRTTDSRLG